MRLYLLDLPAARPPSTPAPCVLNLHGLGATAAQQARYTQLGPKGSARGYVVITPQGIGRVPRWRIQAVRHRSSLSAKRSTTAWSTPNSAKDRGPAGWVAGPLEGNELVLIPMYAEMLRRPPPS